MIYIVYFLAVIGTVCILWPIFWLLIEFLEAYIETVSRKIYVEECKKDTQAWIERYRKEVDLVSDQIQIILKHNLKNLDSRISDIESKGKRK